jgi:hypothetical protein
MLCTLGCIVLDEPPSLDPVRSKIFRAAEHYQSLVSALQRYGQNKPREILAKADSSVDCGVSVLTKPAIPDQIPLMVGDCLQNLRSSLDYLAWELCRASNSVPGKNHMFPICSNEANFSSALKRGRLAGIDKDAIEEIHGLQPYANGQDYQSSNLWLLDELNNINKHRRILLAELQLSVISDDGIRAQKRHSKISVDERGQIQVDGELIAYVAITERIARSIELCSALTQIAQFIGEDLIARFERFFR